MNNAHSSASNDNTIASTYAPARETLEDTYFLDRDYALEIAQRQNKIAIDDNRVLQLCYYDGTPFEKAPDNLVHVPVNDFTAFFSSNRLRIPTYLYHNNDLLNTQQLQEQQTTFCEIIEEVRQIRATVLPAAEQKEEFRDCYFFDRELALETAQQQNRVATVHPTIDGLQICYYDGEPIENGPENLINVNFKDILSFLATTRLRYPSRVIYPAQATAAQHAEITELFNRVITEADNQREQLAESYLNKLRVQQPVYAQGEPFRIYFRACRLTTVMQYVSKNLAKTFESLGHISKVSVEQNEMEILHRSWHYKEQYEFNPHIFVNINHTNNEYLHPDLVNIIWWQDPMAEIKKMEPLHWRERDVVFSLTPPLDKYLQQCGAKDIKRQLFCTDTSVFKRRPEIKREDKIIFVGASYITHLAQPARNMQRNAEVVNELAVIMEQGIPISEDMIRQIADNYDMDFDHVFWNLYHVVVRNKTVEWLCQYTHLPVEIYGYEWEYNTIVSPHFNGGVAHGEELVRLYNSAKYALVSHPFEVNSQRLNEAAACGCIPLVFDCRHSAEQPHWNDELMYFKTREALYRIIDNKEGTPVPHIGENFSYHALARHIINIAEQFYLQEPNSVSALRP